MFPRLRRYEVCEEADTEAAAASPARLSPKIPPKRMACGVRLQVRHVRRRLLQSMGAMSRVRVTSARDLSLSSRPSSWDSCRDGLFLLGRCVGFAQAPTLRIATSKYSMPRTHVCDCCAASSSSRLLVMVPFLDTVICSESLRSQCTVPLRCPNPGLCV